MSKSEWTIEQISRNVAEQFNDLREELRNSAEFFKRNLLKVIDLRKGVLFSNSANKTTLYDPLNDIERRQKRHKGTSTI